MSGHSSPGWTYGESRTGEFTVLVYDDEGRAEELVLGCLVALGHAGVENLVQLVHPESQTMVRLTSCVVSSNQSQLNQLLLRVSECGHEVVMFVLRRDVKGRRYRSAEPQVLLKRCIESSYPFPGMRAFAEQLDQCSGWVRIVVVYCDILYISLQFYDCESLGTFSLKCPSERQLVCKHAFWPAALCLALVGAVLFMRPQYTVPDSDRCRPHPSPSERIHPDSDGMAIEAIVLKCPGAKGLFGPFRRGWR